MQQKHLKASYAPGSKETEIEVWQLFVSSTFLMVSWLPFLAPSVLGCSEVCWEDAACQLVFFSKRRRWKPLLWHNEPSFVSRCGKLFFQIGGRREIFQDVAQAITHSFAIQESLPDSWDWKIVELFNLRHPNKLRYLGASHTLYSRWVRVWL